MHIQRALLLPPAILGALTVALTFTPLLSWVAPAMAGDLSTEKVFEWKIRVDVISLACFGLSLLMTLSGGISRPMSWLGRLMNFVLAIVPLLTAVMIVMQYSTTIINLFGWQMTVQAELFWPGLATWLTLASALVLMITSLFVGFFGRGKKLAPNSPKSPSTPPITAEDKP